MDAKCFNCGKKVGEFDNLQSSIAQINKALTKITAPANFYLFCDPCGTLIAKALELLKQKPQYFWGTPPFETLNKGKTTLANPDHFLDEILRRTKQHNLDRNKQAPQKEVVNTQKEEPKQFNKHLGPHESVSIKGENPELKTAFEQLMKESGMM